MMQYHLAIAILIWQMTEWVLRGWYWHFWLNIIVATWIFLDYLNWKNEYYIIRNQIPNVICFSCLPCLIFNVCLSDKSDKMDNAAQFNSKIKQFLEKVRSSEHQTGVNPHFSQFFNLLKSQNTGSVPLFDLFFNFDLCYFRKITSFGHSSLYRMDHRNCRILEFTEKNLSRIYSYLHLEFG